MTPRVATRLAPWLVAAQFVAAAAHADLPPAPWHLGQTASPSPPVQTKQMPRPSAVFTIDPTTPELLVLRGGNVGDPYALTCAPGELAVGIWGRAGTKIDAIGLYCAKLRPNGNLGVVEQRPAIGATMGQTFALQCPRHEAIISLRGRSDTTVWRVGIGCARVRRWVDQGTRGSILQSAGGNQGSPFADECSAGYVLQGIVGYAGTTINAVRALCVPIVS